MGELAGVQPVVEAEEDVAEFADIPDPTFAEDAVAYQLETRRFRSIVGFLEKFTTPSFAMFEASEIGLATLDLDENTDPATKRSREVAVRSAYAAVARFCSGFSPGVED